MIPRVVRLAAAGAVLTVAACTDSGAPDQRLEVSVTISQNPLVPGDSTDITVRVLNPTTHMLRVDAGPCILYYEVRDAAGVVVAPESRICPLMLIDSRLAPGASFAFSFPWRGDRGGLTRELLAPGTYQLRGFLDATDGPSASPPVAVVLLAAGT